MHRLALFAALLLACSSTAESPTAASEPASAPGAASPGAAAPGEAAPGEAAPAPAGPPEAAAAAALPESSADEQALARARSAAQQLGGTLKSALLGAMKQDGPTGAFELCAGQAHPLTKGVAEDTGVAVGRSSLRLRNPANAGPAWVTTWLEATGERPAEGVEGFARVESVDGRRVARVLTPLAVAPPCLACHGAPGQLAPGVPERLAVAYPEDRATGYAPGELRGAVWAEAPVQ